jgi:pilus assembly protein CpaF
VVSAVGSAVDTVEAEVRELVRRRGLDPVEDRLAMRRLIDEVVLDDDERALSSTMPPLPDPQLAARAVYDAVAGFGPLQRYLDDPEIEELWIKEPGFRRPPGSLGAHDDDPGRRAGP